MPPRVLLLPSRRPLLACAHGGSSRRPFFSLPSAVAAALNPSSSTSSSSGGGQTITVTRTLPYPPAPLYDLIADVDAYASFLPHCHASRVTEWSDPLPTSASVDTPTATTEHQHQQQSHQHQQQHEHGQEQEQEQRKRGRRWPRRGTLTVGYGPLTQTYSSRLYCHPATYVVEAVSGRASPTLSPSELRDIGLDADAEARRARESRPGDTFESLVTRWRVIPSSSAESESESSSPPSSSSASSGAGARRQSGGVAAMTTTRVELAIRYKFANPVFQLATGQFGEEIAKLMIEAFEKRAREKLGPAGGGAGSKL
ncbi:uncharacterized protein E0L32_009783 [Thyridium curvatum]|uniref:Coenzyme Q-binding protein COQ10 START domain-containing protein n=1 Tax=Thyridium curvatum TaxID=1093900 RepID=A0A507AUY9_9PEZI|nr:uncharacterized protein E0L32_009783 [Thyridium curvatum]TPX08721.1 hypothetical protein E0L32_009783 [Thyridium curvatum]